MSFPRVGAIKYHDMLDFCLLVILLRYVILYYVVALKRHTMAAFYYVVVIVFLSLFSLFGRVKSLRCCRFLLGGGVFLSINISLCDCAKELS